MKYAGPFAHDCGPCPYLPKRRWRTLSLYVQQLDPEDLERMLEQGFRRCANSCYINVCEGCSECIPIRVPVAGFAPSRTQRGVWRKNQDVELSIVEARYTDEGYRLYADYVERKFFRARPSEEDYCGFLVENLGCTSHFEYRLEGRLVGLGVVDVTPRAANSVYFAYDVGAGARRLGTYSMLREIEFCRSTGRDFLYMGFYVRDCRAMRYKAAFGPHEILVKDRGWVVPEPGATPHD
ncbi:MAG: arginyltransferase [Candidatus Eremiobacterota bacterium]